MKKIITLSNHARKCLFAKAYGYACRLALEKKMLLTVILLTNVLIASFSQRTSVLLSTGNSCPVQPPQQQQTAFALQAVGVAPMVRVAYVIPSNRTPQPNGVANLQNAIKLGQQFFKDQMEQNGFGPKTFVFETEADGVTPLINVVHVAETDEYLRGDLWGRTQQAASNAGISLWAAGEVWVVIPETHLMFPDGSGAGGVALGAGFGSGNGGGVSMIGSNALPLFRPGMITDDTPYDGKVLPELGPYPMKQDVTFAWFEGTTFSSIASSWLGALWHETGHAFGLGHDFRNDNNFHGNLMGNGLRGTRGSLFPEKYPQDYTRLEYWTALFFNVNHFFNSDKTGSSGPTVSYTNPTSVTPQLGLVHISFQASDPDGLSFAYLVYGGDMAAEMLLDGTTADATFAVPYFTQGNINGYTIFVLDKQGNKTAAGAQFNVLGGNNQAPIPFIRIDPPVPGLNQSITLDASQSSDVDHDQSSLLASWDVDNDGQFDIEPGRNKTVQYQYKNGGNYLIRLKVTDPAGAQTISTAVSVKIPGAVAQVCQGDVTLSSQAQVDAFNCVEVDGNLTISGNSISNLDGLATLKKVSNGLIIRDNPALLNLNGLMNLTAVGGGLSVTNNDKLTDLNGFSSLGSIAATFGSLQIGDNQLLNNLDGFSSLINANGPITITDNPFLETINGFSAMSTLRGGIIISNNEALKSINGFNGLEAISPTSFRARLILTVVNNKSLTGIDGFSSLTGLFGARSGASVTISDNPALKDVDGLSSLSTISDVDIFASNVLTISNNATLENIDGLSALRASDHPERLTVTVTQNPSLTRCCGLFNYLSSGGLNLILTENGAGCTIDDVLAGGPCIAQVCQGDFVLSSQAEVDAFNCEEVSGSLTISGNDITNLNSLSTLKRVGGHLMVTGNGSLPNVDGLSALNQVGVQSSSPSASITISNNPVLKNLDGFSSLTIMNGAIIISDNPQLETVNGFLQVTRISFELRISNNDQLKSINGFKGLRFLGSFIITSLTIDDNASLLNIDGLSSLESVVGKFASVQITNNGSLSNINGLKSLTSISSAGAALNISRNPALKNLDGLASLSRIGLESFGSMVIESNTSLENIDGLARLRSGPIFSTSSRIIVIKNTVLSKCDGLFPLLESMGSESLEKLIKMGNINVSENGAGCTIEDIIANGVVFEGDVTLSTQAEVDAFYYTEVTGALAISGNDITNVDALSALTRVKSLTISGNGSLTNVDGLSALTQVGFTSGGVAPSAFIDISNNPLLANLDGFSSLSTLHGPITINNNASVETINGFLGLTKILYGLTISNNNQLKSFNGFKQVVSIESFFVTYLTIDNNASLTNVDGLSSLSRLPGKTSTTKITNNAALLNIDGLSSLSAFAPTASTLEISNNPALKNVNGLKSITAFGVDNLSKLIIHNNAALENLDGLSSIKTFLPFHYEAVIIHITKNQSLSQCSGLFPLLALMGKDIVNELVALGNINVSENGAGCTIEDIIANGQAILSYDIVNTTGAVVRHLIEGDVLYLDDLKCKGQTIVANTAGEIGSVKFDLNNAFFMMQNASPYTLTGDNYGTYFTPWIPQAGAYTLTATPYSQSDAGGVAGKSLTIHFTVKPGTAVVSYDIVNTSGTFLRHLNEGDILFLDDLKANGQTIVANTTGEIGSVKFDLNNKFFMVQNAFPYTLTGDNYGTYFQPWVPHPGAYTLIATPYSKPDAVGCAGHPLTIHFMVKPKSSTAVVSYDIVNTSGEFVRRLNEGDILYLDDLKGKGQTIVANTTGQIGSVKFDLNNAFFMMQNAFPYTLTGDNYGTYFKPWTPQAGAYALTATPYSKSDAGGIAGRSLTIHVTVVDKNTGVARMIGTDSEEDSPEGDGVSGLTIYPVPVDNELSVKMTDTIGKDALLSILTVQGVVVYEGTYSKSLLINTVDLKPGVYVLQVVENNGFKRVVRFIKK